jgi:hypothetical protein
MEETKRQEFRDFTNKAWDGAVRHERNYDPPHKKLRIGKANDWIIENIKETTGIDMAGFSRNITNDFVVHVHNRHGNEKKENDRRQTAVKPNNLEAITEITEAPDYTMVGGKLYTQHGLRDAVIYAKIFGDKTFIYSEMILQGKKNKSLTSSTLFIRNTVLSQEAFYSIMKSNSENDITNTKIIGGAGGQTDSGANQNVRATGATSALPANTSLLAKITGRVNARIAPLAIPNSKINHEYYMIF